MPNLGSVVLVLVLLSAFPIIASSIHTSNSSSLTTIPYQGRLADTAGSPITDKVNMEFRVYEVPTGGVPLWEEYWTGANAVNVSDGLFSVMLGSMGTGLADVVQAHDELYLGVTIGTDSEMEPRVQLGSVPFSIQALTVPDGSITTAKLAPDTYAAFGGRPGSYPYVLHLHHLGLWQESFCWGYVPGDPELALTYPDATSCQSYPGLDKFTQGLNVLAHSGSGHIRAANNLGYVRQDPVDNTIYRTSVWGYAYSFFLHNPGTARDYVFPLASCNDVAIYLSTGPTAVNSLGNDVSLAYHRFPGPSDEDLSCPCDTISPTLHLPAGDFRLSLLTRGASCTSYIDVGLTDDGGVTGNWIEEAGLTVDWTGLRTYLGESR
jgi:hypothetical protein